MSETPSGTREGPLELVDHSDTRFLMRVASRVSDLKRSLEVAGQEETVELLGRTPYSIIDGLRSFSRGSLHKSGETL